MLVAFTLRLIWITLVGINVEAMDLAGLTPDQLLDALLQANATVTDTPSAEANRAYVTLHTAVSRHLQSARALPSTTADAPAAAAARPQDLDDDATRAVFEQGHQLLVEQRRQGRSLSPAGFATPGGGLAFVTPPSHETPVATAARDDSFYGPGALPLVPTATATTRPQPRQTTAPPPLRPTEPSIAHAAPPTTSALPPGFGGQPAYAPTPSAPPPMPFQAAASAPSLAGGFGSTMIGKEADKIFVPALPSTRGEYQRWRYQVRAAVVAASPMDLGIYFAQLDSQQWSYQDLMTHRDPSHRTIDGKLFSSILLMCKGTNEATLIADKVQLYCDLGCGRQILRLLDSHFLQAGAHRQQQVLSELMASKAGSFDNLDEFLVQFEQGCAQLRGTAEEISDTLACTLLRSKLAHFNKLSATFAQWSMLGANSAHPLAELVQGIRLVILENRSRALASTSSNHDNNKANAAQTTTPPSTVAAARGDYVHPRSKGKGKDGKGKSKDKNKGDGKNNANAYNDKQCHHCGRKGHMILECWFNPSSPSFKGERSAAAFSAASSQAPPSVLSVGSSLVSPSTAAAALSTSPPMNYLETQLVDFLRSKYAGPSMPRSGVVRSIPRATPSKTWILDSGTDEHVHGGSDLEVTRASGWTPSPLATCGGITETEGTVAIDSDVGNFTGVQVSGSPNLISMGRLVQAGYRFAWDDFAHPTLVDPMGRSTQLRVEGFCPVIGPEVVPRSLVASGFRDDVDDFFRCLVGTSSSPSSSNDETSLSSCAAWDAVVAAAEAARAANPTTTTTAPTTTTTAPTTTTTAPTTTTTVPTTTEISDARQQALDDVAWLEDGAQAPDDAAWLEDGAQAHEEDDDVPPQPDDGTIFYEPGKDAQHSLTHLPFSPSCPWCLAKIVRRPARRNRSRVEPTKHGQRVHIDMIGPTRPSYDGNRWSCVAHDQYSGYIWAKVSTTKHENKTVSMVRDSFEKSEVVTFHADNGREFSDKFVAECRRLDARVERSAPYRPQSNSIAERLHRTLEEGARCLLAQSGLPYQFWDLAMLAWIVNYNDTACAP